MQIGFIITIIFSNFLLAELPIGFTEEEWNNRHLIQEMGHRTDPPPAPVRNIAEFEPMQGVLIRYPFGELITILTYSVIIIFFLQATS